MKVTVPAIVPGSPRGLKISVPYAIVVSVRGRIHRRQQRIGLSDQLQHVALFQTGALGGILVLALVVVVCNEAINCAELICCAGAQRRAKKRGGVVLVGKPMAKKESVGILMYRLRNSTLEAFSSIRAALLAKKDLGAGPYRKANLKSMKIASAGEARVSGGNRMSPGREFYCSHSTQTAGWKVVHAWAVRGDCDVKAIVSNTFSMEWRPLRKRQEFPEVDRAEWFTMEVGARKFKGSSRFSGRIKAKV